MFRILSDTFFILFANAKHNQKLSYLQVNNKKSLSYLQIYFTGYQVVRLSLVGIFDIDKLAPTIWANLGCVWQVRFTKVTVT